MTLFDWPLIAHRDALQRDLDRAARLRNMQAWHRIQAELVKANAEVMQLEMAA